MLPSWSLSVSRASFAFSSCIKTIVSDTGSFALLLFWFLPLCDFLGQKPYTKIFGLIVSIPRFFGRLLHHAAGGSEGREPLFASLRGTEISCCILGLTS